MGAKCANYRCNNCCTFSLLGDFLHQLSNDGAKIQFEVYLEPFILPAMVQCAKVS